MKYAIGATATLAVLIALALAFPYTGMVNVSAADGDSGLTEWFLGTTARRSIQARADATPPPGWDSEEAIQRGAVAFRQMCQTCHAAPGHERSVTGQGLTPTPPRLGEEADEWSPAELYWILDNGIKMAGMPAYGPTHSPEELWELVAFVESLPETTSEQYEALTAPPEAPADSSDARPLADDGHDHVH